MVNKDDLKKNWIYWCTYNSFSMDEIRMLGKWNGDYFVGSHNNQLSKNEPIRIEECSFEKLFRHHYEKHFASAFVELEDSRIYVYYWSDFQTLYYKMLEYKSEYNHVARMFAESVDAFIICFDQWNAKLKERK
jgi:hypothetical protein